MINFAFDNFYDFLQMGKHGFYVWLCFGLSFLTVLGNVVLYQVNKKTILKHIGAEQIRKKKQQENFK